MRDILDRALDRHADYPPGFRACDLEPRVVETAKTWNARHPVIHADFANWRNAKLAQLHGQMICLHL